MKHLLFLLFFASALFFCSSVFSQDSKVKSKGTKTKIKGKAATDKASTDNATSTMDAGTNTNSNTTTTTDAAANTGTGTGLANTSWKAYIGDPLNDTLTWRYATDSLFALSRTGDALVISRFSAANGNLTIDDVGGTYQCPNQTGKYKFAITGDMLTITLVEDACEGRASVLNNSKWTKQSSSQ